MLQAKELCFSSFMFYLTIQLHLPIVNKYLARLGSFTAKKKICLCGTEKNIYFSGFIISYFAV